MSEAYTGTTVRQRLPHTEIPGCALVQDLIPLYLDGEVMPESHVLMADHLQQCERCSGYLAGARSVRQQLLQEQATITAVRGISQSVPHLQQSAATRLDSLLWQIMLGLIWFGGLYATWAGVMNSEAQPILMGLLAVSIAVGGLLVSRAERGMLWTIMTALTRFSGFFFLLVMPLVNPHILYDLEALLLVTGMVLLGLTAAGWLWRAPRSQPAGGQTEPLGVRGPNAALGTAVLSIVAAIACAVIALWSVYLLGEYLDAGRQLLNVTLLAGSGAGLLIISQRRGWVSLRMPTGLAQAIMYLGGTFAVLVLPFVSIFAIMLLLRLLAAF